MNTKIDTQGREEQKTEGDGRPQGINRTREI